MKIPQFVYCALIAFLVFLSSCVSQQDKMEIEQSASAFDIKQGEASIKQSNQRYMKAFKASDSVEVSNCFSKEGKLLIADTPAIEGRDQIKQYFASLMKNGIKNFEVKSIKIWGDSSLLAEEGTYEMSDINNVDVEKGKYIVLWKPEGGNWKMYRDMYTSNIKNTAALVERKVKKNNSSR
ncbi:MAG: nuclear transport factor 2 family protein [Ginsengibacter sp.]